MDSLKELNKIPVINHMLTGRVIDHYAGWDIIGIDPVLTSDNTIKYRVIVKVAAKHRSGK